ncbi:pentapeptide repeat-containing protein [Rhizobium gallicum]|uniref:pentapeptide repeat-containing protein n=1 Tax=Rhizobium gallicum TaxID=56730 RepID=UPI001EF992DD|nr:pentapeptide repeat-containing protein [Rhizobium gallicum]ULJ73619.1 pentapeptide repeat-containing protein [Rhizobium gallicum]
MTNSSEKPPIGDKPSGYAIDWFNCAVGLAIAVALAVIAAAVYVFQGTSDAQVVARAQALSPFGVAAFALITFMTVVWRGILNTEQLHEQTRQNNAKDDENLAKLLIDGTKLVGEANDHHVMAGIAALQAVVTSPRGTFAVPGMDILADKIKSTDITMQWSTYKAAVRALNGGAAMGYKASNALTLTSSETPEGESLWLAINGLPMVSFIGGYFSPPEYSAISREAECRFSKTTFENCKIDQIEGRRFMHCVFRSCQIRAATWGMLASGQSTGCDFSGLRVSSSEAKWERVVIKVRNRGNWYYADDPPQEVIGLDWSQICEVRERT